MRTGGEPWTVAAALTEPWLTRGFVGMPRLEDEYRPINTALLRRLPVRLLA